jgi:hypothetical protein
MRKFIFILLGVLILLTAFSTKTHLSQDNPQTSKDEVLAVLEKFHFSFGNRDTATLSTIITGPGIFCGTIPWEIADDKNFVLNYLMTDYFADTATVYSVTDREIQISPDEKSAIAMEQFIYPPRSKRFYTRCNSHLIKINGKWMINSFTLSFVISDIDLAKISEIMQ